MWGGGQERTPTPWPDDLSCGNDEAGASDRAHCQMADVQPGRARYLGWGEGNGRLKFVGQDAENFVVNS